MCFFFLPFSFYLLPPFFIRAKRGGGGDSGRCWQSLFKLSGIMEDYFCAEILACVPVFSLSLSSPFLFLVVADTLGKQFVSHLIAFEKLKNKNHNRPGLGDEDWGDTDTIRPWLFGDPWYDVWQSCPRSHNNTRPCPSENTPRSQSLSLSALGHLLSFSLLPPPPPPWLLSERWCVWIWLNYSSTYKHKHSTRLEVCKCVCAF